MIYPHSAFIKVCFKSFLGIFLIGFSVTMVCWIMVSSSESNARYDCYVWGFNHAVCSCSKTLKNYSGYSRCKEHLIPVSLCESFSETEKGLSDALRFIEGESVEVPPSNRNYRTFHLNY